MYTPPAASHRLGDCVLLVPLEHHRVQTPAFQVGRGEREPCEVDAYSDHSSALVQVSIELGVSALMPHGSLAVVEVGGYRLGAQNGCFIARRALPGVSAGELIQRLSALSGALPVEVAARLGLAMMQGFDGVPPRVAASPHDVAIGWDGRVACRMPGALFDRFMSLGRARWMSPESIRDVTQSAAARVHEAAAMVFALLARQHFVPFTEDSPYSVLVAVLQSARTPILTCRPDLDPSLARVLDASLRLSPAERPTSVELATTLQRFAHGCTADTLSGLLAGVFSEEREASMAWWDDARCLDLDRAPRIDVERLPPPMTLKAALDALTADNLRRT